MKNEFVWGVSSSAFQIEGATSEGGRGLSTWDVYTRTPGKILNGDTADIACDHYHRYREDVKLMAELGVTGYRFSIAWPRIVPDGVGAPNPAGIAFYSDLIDTLLEYGIQPYPTLYHWDLPVINQFVADGWLSRQTAEAFARYAGICFEAFGDRVRHWITGRSRPYSARVPVTIASVFFFVSIGPPSGCRPALRAAPRPGARPRPYAPPGTGYPPESGRQTGCPPWQ